ncbi:amino acid adenylation domain-containing protein [Embleya sp. AB8]|uniref:amino acid adenylation domain-containing protein n=1 Tax=Embleya sp. AB8 TaxID=3156304 RepID=UPI003C78E8F2
MDHGRVSTDHRPGPGAPQRDIVEAFTDHVRRAPDRLAVTDGSVRLTYAQLDARSDAVAHALARRRPESAEPRVALAMGRGHHYIGAVLGAAKAGWVCVPLDPRWPPARIRLLLRQARVRLLLHDERFDTGAHMGPELCRVQDLDIPTGTHEHPFTGSSSVPPEAALCVFYTSGSTGSPKGVVVTRRGVRALAASCGPALGWTRPPRCLVIAPNAFDASTFEIWTTLVNGGSCRVVPGLELTFRNLREGLGDTDGADLVFLTTTLFNAVVDEEPEVLAGARQIIVGGEQASAAHIAALMRRHPHLDVVNAYGPTEATTFSTFDRLPAPPSTGGLVPIGTPLPHAEVRILDSGSAPVPDGEVGELCVVGDGLARGYLDRPDLTAAAFVPDPTGEPGGRVYRTGDLGRRRADGTLECIGRLDSQVKIRGHRIECDEVQHVLRGHPFVRDAVVAPRRSDGACVGLDAHVSVHPDRGPDAAAPAITTWLRERLPEYMIPRVVVVAGLPRNHNGKIDRTLLDPRTAIHGHTADA